MVAISSRGFPLAHAHFSACVIVPAVHSTLSNSSANHLRPALLSVRWSANDPMARRSIGKIGICKARSDVWHRSTFSRFHLGLLMLLLICITQCEWLMESSVSFSGEDSAAGVHLSGVEKVSRADLEKEKCC